ncbi:GNAT family N-acetyltransferase [Pseudalkalibacillus hwajinpoensis]|uniref:GNAT family N-acetyltransferase n=1 Tax=Guptibacillus hwajinpoensis TaxID=208199 RepID=UPI001CD5AF39|nr:GNAT family N-acetyltransferase [Pseudalkalibacillus hwajinpoensis]MCA0992147.1 GNAT family N-acetyltransferase [Pseudalkalibacillus hwajinpoensis]
MNVILRLIKKGDLPLIQQYLSKDGVSRMTNIPEPYPTNGASDWFEIVMEEFHEGNHYPFAIIADDQFAGSISVRREQDRIGAIDYWVAPPFWKKGIGTKAAEQAVDFGRNELGFKSFETCCLIENKGSARILEKIGFQKGKEFLIGSGEKHGGKMARLYYLY